MLLKLKMLLVLYVLTSLCALPRKILYQRDNPYGFPLFLLMGTDWSGFPRVLTSLVEIA